jgi:hypothetical protein
LALGLIAGGLTVTSLAWTFDRRRRDEEGIGDQPVRYAQRQQRRMTR